MAEPPHFSEVLQTKTFLNSIAHSDDWYRTQNSVLVVKPEMGQYLMSSASMSSAFSDENESYNW